MITIVTPPSSTALTSLARLKDDLGLTTVDAARDRWLQRRIDEASSLLLQAIGRTGGEGLARAEVLEQLPGSGRSVLLVGRTPIVSLLGVTQCGQDVSGVGVRDADAGELFRACGWPEVVPIETWIESDRKDEPGVADYRVSMIGGYLLPGDNLTVSGISFDAAARTITIPSGSLWPSLLASGDTLQLAGFALNSGRRTVLERVSDVAVRVAEALADETGGANGAIDVSTLPPALEGFAIATVAAWYGAKTQNPNVKGEKLGDWSADYVTGSGLRQLPEGIADAAVAVFGRVDL